MVSDAVLGIIIQMGTVVLLCIGFTFTYQIERFPNFAHIGFAVLGTVVSFHMTKLVGLNPYLSWPFSAVFCGLAGVLFYLAIVIPIKRKREDPIAITIAFYALAIVLETLVAVYGYWVVVSRHETTRGFGLKLFDIKLFDLPGVVIISPITCITIGVVLYYILTRTRFGLSIRAVSENEDLAAVFGINTTRVHIYSWFIAGALAGIAGAIIPLWTSIRGGFSEEMLVSVMAGCIIGGLDSISGAVLGGVIISLFQHGLLFVLMNMERNGTPLLVNFSFLIREFSKLVPIIFIFVILMLMPEGITGYLQKKARTCNYYSHPKSDTNYKHNFNKKT